MSVSATPPFADKVSRAMRERGVSLRALCRDVGVDASFFSKVLAGKRSPPVEEDVLRRVAAALALDPAELVVSAGRIPSEWRGVWADPALFARMNHLAAGAPAAKPLPPLPASPSVKARPASPKREPSFVPPPPRKATFGDELL